MRAGGANAPREASRAGGCWLERCAGGSSSTTTTATTTTRRQRSCLAGEPTQVHVAEVSRAFRLLEQAAYVVQIGLAAECGFVPKVLPIACVHGHAPQSPHGPPATAMKPAGASCPCSPRLPRPHAFANHIFRLKSDRRTTQVVVFVCPRSRGQRVFGRGCAARVLSIYHRYTCTYTLARALY